MFGDPYQNFGWGGLLDQWTNALDVARAAFRQQQQAPAAHMPGMGEPEGGAGGLGDPPGTLGQEMVRGAPSGSAVAPGLFPSPLAPGAGSPMGKMAGHLHMPGVEDMMPWQDQQRPAANENLAPPGYKPGPQKERPYPGFRAPSNYEG